MNDGWSVENSFLTNHSEKVFWKVKKKIPSRSPNQTENLDERKEKRFFLQRLDHVSVSMIKKTQTLWSPNLFIL